TVPLMRCDGSLFVAALRCSWQGRASRCLSGCAFIFGRCIEAGYRTLEQQPLRRVTGPTSIGRHAPSPCGIQVCKSANELVSELAPTSPLNRAGLAGPDSLTKPEALRCSRACFTALAKKLSEQFLTLRSGGPKDGRHGWQATNTNAQPGKPCPGQPGTSQPGSGRIAEEVLHTLKPRPLARRMLVGAAIKRLLQLFQQFCLAFAQVHRRLDNDAAEQIARATAAHRRHALAAQAEEFAGLRFWRNFQLYATFERRHFELTAQRRVGKTDRHFAEQMLAVALENRMFAHRYLHVEIADRTTVRTRFAFTCETNSIAGIDTRRHFHRQRLGFFNHATAITLAARVRDHLALAATVRAGLLYREKALLHANLAGAATGCTC